MDVGRAFSFPFQDSDWIKNILIGGLVSLIPIVGNWMVYGYALEVAKDAYDGNDDQMPGWSDLGGYLVRGLLIQVGLLIWTLPLAIVFGCGFVVAIAVGNGSDVAGGILTFINICFLVIFALIWFAALFPIIGGRYAVHRRFGAMFEFGEIISEIQRAGVALLLFLLVAIIAEFIGSLGLIVCFIGVIFTSFYSEIVIGHAAGQLYREASDQPETEPHPAF